MQSLTKQIDDILRKKTLSIGICHLKGKDKVKCDGYLQDAHVISRRYYKTRWLPENHICICQGHHRYYTDRSDEWKITINRVFSGLYDELWSIAWNKGKPADYTDKDKRKILKNIRKETR